MKNTAENLPNFDYNSLLANYYILENSAREQCIRIEEQQSTINYLQFELLKLKKMFSGSRKETFNSSAPTPAQPTLFNIDPIADTEVKKTEVPAHTRNKVDLKPRPHKGRNPFPDHLKRVVTVLAPENIPADAKQIGVDVSETLEYTPGNLYVNRTERPRFVIPQSQQVVAHPALERILGKSMFGNSFAAHSIVSKYVDHLPENRQIAILKREGIEVASSSINDLHASVAHSLLTLYDVLRQEVFSQSYLQADETTNRVLTKEKKGKAHNGYFWAYWSIEKKAVFFDYCPGRGGEGPRDKLKNFKGHLQCDGYSVYEQFGKLENITVFHCWAHARRYFLEALEVAKDSRAKTIMEQIQALYKIERQARDAGMTFEQRKELRQKESLPLLSVIKERMDTLSLQLTKKEPLAKAVAYAQKRWQGLIHYVTDGRLEIDNNLVENSIRPITLGRNNHLFSGSHDGAKRSAIFYSFMGTCKLRNVNPYIWLKNTLDKLPFTKPADLYTLLP